MDGGGNCLVGFVVEFWLFFEVYVDVVYVVYFVEGWGDL